MPLTERELDALRQEQKEWMPELVTVRRKVFVGDEESGSDYAPKVVASNVPTAKTPGFGNFGLVADRFQGITPYSFVFPWDQDLRVSDQIIEADGTVYEVRDVRDKSSWQTAIQVLADRIH